MPKQEMPAEKLNSEQTIKKEAGSLVKQDLALKEGEKSGVIGGVEEFDRSMFDMRLNSALEENGTALEQMDALNVLRQELVVREKQIKEIETNLVRTEIDASNQLKEAYRQAKTSDEKRRSIKALADRIFKEKIIVTHSNEAEKLDYNTIVKNFLEEELENNPDLEIKERIFEELMDVKQAIKDPRNQETLETWNREWVKIHKLLVEEGLKENATENMNKTAQELLKKDWQNFQETAKLLAPESNLPLDEKRRIAQGRILNDKTENLGLTGYLPYNIDTAKQTEYFKFYFNQILDPNQDEEIRCSLAKRLSFFCPLLRRIQNKSSGDLNLFDQAIEALKKSGLKEKSEFIDSFLTQLDHMNGFVEYYRNWDTDPDVDSKKREFLDIFLKALVAHARTFDIPIANIEKNIDILEKKIGSIEFIDKLGNQLTEIIL